MMSQHHVLDADGRQAGVPGWESACSPLECLLQVSIAYFIGSFTTFNFIARTDELSIWTPPEIAGTGDLVLFPQSQLSPARRG